MSWEETARQIAEEAWKSTKTTKKQRLNLSKSVDGCAEVIYTAEAYEVVCSARNYYYETFDIANDKLQDTEETEYMTVKQSTI